MALTSKDINIGSGELYITAATRGTDGSVTLPADNVIETEANRLGHVKDGATITYTATYYEAKDDLGLVSKTVITDETVTLKSGIMTWVYDTLNKLTATGSVSTTTTKKTFKLGGIKGADIKEYVIRFVHSDGIHRVTIVGNNETGFELGFLKDKETVIDAEFKAKPYDTNGHLLQMDEDIPQSSGNPA